MRVFFAPSIFMREIVTGSVELSSTWSQKALAIVLGSTARTRIEEKCARTLELPLLVRRLVYSFSFVSTGG